MIITSKNLRLSNHLLCDDYLDKIVVESLTTTYKIVKESKGYILRTENNLPATNHWDSIFGLLNYLFTVLINEVKVIVNII